MPVKRTIHRINGEAAEMDAIDARHTVRDHPSEWAAEPWSVDAQKRARKEMPIITKVENSTGPWT